MIAKKFTKAHQMKQAIQQLIGGGQNKLNFPFILKLKQQFQRFRRKKRLNSRLLHYVEKLTPPTYLTKIDIHLADHCNLNCFGCSHFSQVAQPKLPTLQTYEKDIKTLSANTSLMCRFGL